MHGMFHDNGIVTNNTTTTHLNDNLVAVGVFSIIAAGASMQVFWN